MHLVKAATGGQGAQDLVTFVTDYRDNNNIIVLVSTLSFGH